MKEDEAEVGVDEKAVEDKAKEIEIEVKIGLT